MCYVLSLVVRMRSRLVVRVLAIGFLVLWLLEVLTAQMRRVRSCCISRQSDTAVADVADSSAAADGGEVDGGDGGGSSSC